MNRIQKVAFQFLSPSAQAGMEAESKQWMLKCPNCGFERSYWDAGGIRWGASGKKRVGGKCPNCGKNVGFEVYKKENAKG